MSTRPPIANADHRIHQAGGLAVRDRVVPDDHGSSLLEFFSNPAGIWDLDHSITSPSRQDILGGLTYWFSQHGTARGGQPWFYYLILLPLYEQFALIFGAMGIAWAFIRRDLFVSFLAFWCVLSISIYSWAGEKMPWLLLHPLLPAILLGSTLAGRIIMSKRIAGRVVITSILLIVLTMELHSSQALVFVNGANPTEMLVYVQTSNDVPMTSAKVLT